METFTVAKLENHTLTMVDSNGATVRTVEASPNATVRTVDLESLRLRGIALREAQRAERAKGLLACVTFQPSDPLETVLRVLREHGKS